MFGAAHIARHFRQVYRLLILFLWPLAAFGQAGASKDIPFTYKEFMNLANYFGSREEMSRFFDFHPGDAVADIGAGEGRYEGAFSLVTDSVSFYSEDLDDKLLNPARFQKMVAHYSALRAGPQTNRFELVIGGEKASGLPDGRFDKLIIISAFHEFTFMDAMIEDLAKKLKPGGRIYIMDAFCTKKGHVNYTSGEVAAKMEQHGFRAGEMQTAGAHGSQGLYKAVFYR